MLKLIRRIVLLLSLAAAAYELGNCEDYTAAYDSGERRNLCVVGQPNEVHLSTRMRGLECARLCSESENCVAVNIYDKIKCEIFTCHSAYTRYYQNVPFCKSFRINDCHSRCSQPDCGFSSPPGDCADIRAAGLTESGVYVINPGNSSNQSSVYCNMSSSGSWLVIQRRMDGSEDFNRTWTEYANGFGNLTGEFWLDEQVAKDTQWNIAYSTLTKTAVVSAKHKLYLRNELLHSLTANRKYRIRVDLENIDGVQRYAEYSTFSVASSSDNYKLSLGSYTGTAGDSLSIHNGDQFSTWEADHSIDTKNCAQTWCAGWWHTTCVYSVLNGVYRNGREGWCKTNMDWWNCVGQNCHSLIMTKMKIA